MSNVNISQIEFFRALNLQHVSNSSFDSLKKRSDRIDRYLLGEHNIKECCVSLQVENFAPPESEPSKIYGLRKNRKKNLCCCLCV